MSEENCIGKWYILPNSDNGEKCIPKDAVFHIPFYQRGYRWTAENIEKLIKDLCAFSDSEYCLQPIVLQKIQTQGSEKRYRVVDGQQRLTTIYILLKALNESPSWDIYYESEKEYISELLNPETGTTTINDYFRNTALETAQKAFQNDSNPGRLKVFYPGKLKEKLKQTAFLIYEIPTNDKDDPKGHKAFLRLNDGKTPLTSSELIRALYMVNDSGISEQNKIEISKEWELIETTLRKEQFWLMLNAKGLEDSPTRLDLLFALVSNVYLNITKANPRVVFEAIENSIQPLDAIWHEIMKCFWWMQSCYQDIETYNYLCWIAKFTNNDAREVYKKWKANPSHESFKKALIDIIKAEFKDISSLDDIRYGDAGFLRKLFVLLNCLECNKTKERFRFDLYNQASWDIEHIDSQTPNDLKDPTQMKAWLEASYNELSDQQKGKINYHNFKKDKNNQFDYKGTNFEDDFTKLANEIIEKLSSQLDEKNEKVDNDSKDKLGNLALLSSSVNRSYHNDIFPVKRKKIRCAIAEGNSYIPPCTQKAFMKFYTEQPSKITYWLKADFDAYAKHMGALYQEFIDISTKSANTDENNSGIKVNNSVNNIEVNDAQKNSNVSTNRETTQMNLPGFMEKYKIIIPKIQRPYVQGRLDKYGKKCLEGFASELVKYIFDENEHSLDFIYGIEKPEINSEEKATFYPIDGQQRLTTLLLLAWLCKKNESDWVFQYESRRMTECFIEALLNSTPPSLKGKRKTTKKEYSLHCSDYIKECDWFQLSWANDPGIAAMLEMLDSLYDKLLKKNQANPSTENIKLENITFEVQYLDVSSKSYDQIFLKMNSRGKELTVWENIKAVLDQYAPNNWKEKINDTWPEKLWSWPSTQEKDIKDIDRKLLLITELALECAGYTEKVENTYALNQWLNSDKNANNRKKFFNICSIFFNQLENNTCESLNRMLTPQWEKEPITINYLESSETYETFYKPLLAHYALCKVCPYTSKDWPRIVWNILENSHFDKSKFKDAFDLIEELSNHSHDILEFLANGNTIESKFAGEQIAEERIKAKLILSCPKWENDIKEAESYPLFKGHISFLLDPTPDENCHSIFTNRYANALNFLALNNEGCELANPDKARNFMECIIKNSTIESLANIHFCLNNTFKNWKEILHKPNEELRATLRKILLNPDFQNATHGREVKILLEHLATFSNWGSDYNYNSVYKSDGYYYLRLGRNNNAWLWLDPSRKLENPNDETLNKLKESDWFKNKSGWIKDGFIIGRDVPEAFFTP